jgi:hypothetical protein
MGAVMAKVPFASDRDDSLRLFQGKESHRLFRRMMSRQGIDLTGGWWHGSEEMIFRALRTCSMCRQTEACRSWLEQEQPRRTYLSFCPNRAIEACRLMDPHAPELEASAPD